MVTRMSWGGFQFFTQRLFSQCHLSVAVYLLETNAFNSGKSTLLRCIVFLLFVNSIHFFSVS